MASLGPSALSMRSRAGGSSVSSKPSPSDAAPAPHRSSSLNGGKRPLSAAAPAQQPHASAAPDLPRAEKLIVAAITLLACFVRLWKIGQPSSVVFDEVHFGGFATKYINRKFFMDVHPPLAKLLIAFVAWINGFDGKFDFKEIGKEYLIGENTPVPYVAIRMMCGIMGVATVPLAYLTLRALSLRATTAIVGALLVTFENSLVTQSRLILLDSPLIFFTALTAFCWVSFCVEEKRRAFGHAWWTWLAATGLSLGCVASVKWVGLFTIATIGVCTIAQLWAHLGDVRQPVSNVARHFAARAVCLIVLPLIVYLSTFAVHLAVLNRSGEGDGFMSSAFQHTLRGHGMPDTYADVALGSTVTIRHVNTQGGYLHSHAHSYPAGSQQQQITLYPHRDENNEFYIVAAPGPNDPPPEVDAEGVPIAVDGPHEVEKYTSLPIQHLRHGMEVRLVHRKSDKRIHSHDAHRPPITESDYQNEVTGYGFPGFLGDANDNWHVEIDTGHSSDAESFKRVRTLRSVVRFRHTLTGCYLFSHKVVLPDWGFGQQEVTCNKNPTRPNSLWFIETNTHPLLEAGGTQPGTPAERRKEGMQLFNYIRPSFLARFKELQRVMWETNAGLTDRHAYDSRPKTWPTLRRGINFWTKDHRQIYLIGNPFVWWGATCAVLVYLGTRALLMLRAKRGKRDWNDSTIVFYDQTCGFLFVGWAMHYLPFWAMHRQLFVHHYLPALYFGILLSAVIFDALTSFLRPLFRLQAAAAVVVVAMLAFSVYAPLTYGGEWTQSACERSRLLKTWDFNCREFPLDKAEWAKFPPPIHTVAHPKSTDSVKLGGPETSAIIDAALGAAQPGEHPFEQAPVKAISSGESFAPVSTQVAQAEQDQEKGADAVQQPPVAGKEAEAAANKVEEAKPKPALEEQKVVPEGLDQEGMEAVVLEGTAAANAKAAAPASTPKAGGTPEAAAAA